MGSGGYTICEWKGVRKTPGYPEFQRAFAKLESEVIAKCGADWHKSFNAALSLTPGSDSFGRTTILPELFDDHNGVQMTNWRQLFTIGGHQTLLAGTRAGSIIPEDFKIAWIGMAFPNKQMNITEVRYQIGDKKHGRVNIEQIKCYDVPAVVFEEGFLIDEEQSFDLWGYVEPLGVPDYQRIVLLGSTYFRYVDKVLGNCGAAI